MCSRASRLLLMLLALTPALPATATVEECGVGNRPGATLLFPYFEVDLTDPRGRTTLISIQNTSDEAILTNVVVWTNCGLPAASFNLGLEPQAVQPIDLRALITAGRIPSSGNGAAFPGCTTPISDGHLGEARTLTLHARLTGRPDPQDGLCHSSSVKPPPPRGRLSHGGRGEGVLGFRPDASRSRVLRR